MHADGALMGFVLPFLDNDYNNDHNSNIIRKYIHSISISGHKFAGVPFPCGIFIIEKRFVDYWNEGNGNGNGKNSSSNSSNNSNNKYIDYIANTDCTIAGSRNGHGALFLDYIIKSKGYKGFKNDIIECIDNAEYLTDKLGKEHNAWKNNKSVTVVFNKPIDGDIGKKWQLASTGRTSHSVVLPHVSKAKINRFAREMGVKF